MTSPLLAVNEYFDGKARAIAFQGASLPATAGIMISGIHEFNTNKREPISVISGALTEQLPCSDDGQTLQPVTVLARMQGKPFNPRLQWIPRQSPPL